MTRRAALGLAAALAGAILPAGCRFLGLLDGQTPPTPEAAAAESVAAGQRVKDVGARIIAQNTFTGLEPFFHTIGIPEPALYHRGTAELFISTGVVRQCKTDEELAAVLCTELAVMVAEKRAAVAAGRDGDSIITGTPDAQTGTAVGAASKRPVSTAPLPGRDELARQLLHGAGFDPAALVRADAIVKTSARGDALEKQMAGSAAAPVWEK